jgi:CheY-like chemotaxis protein/HPt (histidine-containing phosphotransfer) domain-containing protein
MVLTSLGHRLNTATMQETGISACLVKPLRQSRLFDCLADVMSLSGRGTIEPMGHEAPASAAVSPLASAVKNVRVLLAEDNMVNQRLALKQLKKLGYHADAVANGCEVLKALEQIRYDIILMDCQMPEMDGYEVSRRIRESENQPGQPPEFSPYIIALTANVLHGDREKCLGAGMNDYLTKPLYLADLDAVLQRALLKVHPSPRPEPERNEGALDPVVIAGLRELREPNQPDPLKELAELFLRDARSRLQKMEVALERKDLPSLALAAHTLKGSASNLGARRLAALCVSLEKQAKTGELTEAADILLEAKSEFEAVEKTLLAEMQK